MRILLIFLFSFLYIAPVQANEGAGLIASDIDGALPKTLWADQKRSEIIAGLNRLSVNSPYKSVQSIKRDLLISTYDLSNIENDIPANNENNLLTIRLKKLMEMGLWADALKLYNKAVQDPEDNMPLAETGVTLIFLEKGLSTACLEAKVLMPRYSGDFWTQIDTICKAELYGDKPITTQLGDSPILKALYFEPSFSIPADNIEAFNNMTFLEAAATRNNERIRYKNITVPDDIPLKVSALFTSDANAPDSLKKAIAPPKEESKAQTEEERLSSERDVLQHIISKLQAGESLNDKDTENLSGFAKLYPENYFYLEIIHVLDFHIGNYVNTEDKINLGTKKLIEKQRNNVKLLQSLLDKPEEFSNNPSSAYEKQRGVLTLSVLNELSEPFLENSGDKSLDKKDTPLNRLRNVGLIQQAHLIAREVLANLMLLQLKEI